ncbi:small heat shock protein, chloroplastic-like [Chenopodium quinoa]|uniref:SHSP domain-containing protein n=1 Tax=Chenopodium quinoa TaxID=63459 RepID=A0A803L4S7_CHEQI|nr:small heat shock protein, chloroplastic-like [Chenopodium quinoa]
MASNTLTCSGGAATMVSNHTVTGRSPALVGFGQRVGVSLTPSLKTPSMVVRAQQGGSPKKMDPMSPNHFHKKVALLETSPYVRTPWNTNEDEHEIRMWFDMPGLAAENIDVNVVDDLLVIKGDGGVDAFGNKIFSPYDSRVQLPLNSWKEEITAVFKNGVLYITVPKITKFEHKIIHVPVRSV